MAHRIVDFDPVKLSAKVSVVTVVEFHSEAGELIDFCIPMTHSKEFLTSCKTI